MPEKHRGDQCQRIQRVCVLMFVWQKKKLNMLDEYCQRMGVSRPQGLSDGIKDLSAKE